VDGCHRVISKTLTIKLRIGRLVQPITNHSPQAEKRRAYKLRYRQERRAEWLKAKRRSNARYRQEIIGSTGKRSGAITRFGAAFWEPPRAPWLLVSVHRNL
jgi:hypothetical protein